MKPALTPRKALEEATPEQSLPPFPSAATRLMGLLDREDVLLGQISSVIRADPSLLTRLLKEANSPLYSRQGACSTLSQAVQVLGMQRVKQVSMAMLTRGFFRSSGFTPTLRACWRHSVATAVIADNIAGKLRVSAELSYVMGLLHDVGRMAMAACHREEYTSFLKTQRSALYQLEQEREVFGTDHASVGRKLASNWRLPAQISLVAGRHHDRPLVGDPWEVFVSNMACRLASAFGYCVQCSQRETPQSIVESVPRVFQLAIPRDMEQWAAQVVAEVKASE